jgi:hypothetical protein
MRIAARLGARRDYAEGRTAMAKDETETDVPEFEEGSHKPGGTDTLKTGSGQGGKDGGQRAGSLRPAGSGGSGGQGGGSQGGGGQGSLQGEGSR